MSEPLTDVIFRVWCKDGDVIALFPGIAGDYSAGTCDSFQHIGQHGAASLNLMRALTRPALPREFADLKRELESAPYKYRLRIIKRTTRRHFKERQAQLQRA
jgi:hypothetical protein